MPKKKQVNTSDVQFTSEPEIKVVSTNIALLNLDLGRDDLNKLVEKINEIIKKVN